LKLNANSVEKFKPLLHRKCTAFFFMLAKWLMLFRKTVAEIHGVEKMRSFWI